MAADIARFERHRTSVRYARTVGGEGQYAQLLHLETCSPLSGPLGVDCVVVLIL